MKKKFSIILLLLMFSTFLGGCGDSNAGLPSHPAQMTNKQKQQFQEWQANQDRQKWDNGIIQ